MYIQGCESISENMSEIIWNQGRRFIFRIGGGGGGQE